MKTVVITGSARGLGYEMALRFRRKGFNVVLSDLNEENLAKAQDALLKEPGEGSVAKTLCNVTSFKEIEDLMAFALEKFGAVDIWINNAGINQPDKPVYELSEKEISLMIDVDLKGAVYGSRIAYEQMKKQG